jgi:hypothetical protein
VHLSCDFSIPPTPGTVENLSIVVILAFHEVWDSRKIRAVLGIPFNKLGTVELNRAF